MRKALSILCVICTVYCDDLISSNLSYGNHDCLLSFTRRITTDQMQQVVYVYDDDDDNRLVVDRSKPLVVVDVNYLNYLKFNTDAYVMFLNHRPDLYSNVIDILSKRLRSNSKVVIVSRRSISDEDLSLFFANCWKHFVIEIYVIVDDLVYTYFPYEHGKCGQDIRVVSHDCRNYTIPGKIPYDLNGCPVRIMAFKMVPYVIDTDEDRTDPSKAGFEVTIMHAIATKMNFTPVYVANRHRSWGYKSYAGEYIMMYKSLYDKEMDVKMGMSYGNASYLIDFDGSYVYLTEKTVWWVPIALPIPRWKNITAIFQPVLWLLIFVVFVVNGVAWRLFGREESSAWFSSATMSLMGSLYTLLQGSISPPSRWRSRMIFVVWLYSCLLLFAAHQSSLVSILTTPLYDHQVATQEELVETYKFGFYEGALTAFEENNSLHRYIRNNYFQCPLSNMCMNMTAYDRNFAYYKNSRNAKYYLPRLYTVDDRKLIYEIEGAGVGVWVRLHTLKRFPLLNRIDELLMRLQSNGLINKWDADLSYAINKDHDSQDRESLNMEHLQGAFLILLFGVAVSSVTFLFEITRRKIKNLQLYYRQY